MTRVGGGDDRDSSSPADPGAVQTDVLAFYDTHPINEPQVLAALADRGIALHALSQAQLQAHDQDHFGGLEANDALIGLARVGAADRVLAVGSVLGGPARSVAAKPGGRVVGLEINRGRPVAARRFTRQVQLEHLVSFELGNALDMPFPDASFDVVMGQEAWCHVPDKPRLIGECTRVLRRGGVIAFTDILGTPSLGADEMARLRREMAFPDLESISGYRALLEARGCQVESCEDLGPWWTRVLIDRLAMYRGLGSGTARQFGRERSDAWDSFYGFFVDLYQRGHLTGARFLARRA